MRLRLWLEQSGMRRKAVAVQWGVSVASLQHWSSGRRVPRPAMQERIAVLTEGLVQPADHVRQAVEWQGSAVA